jgi:hypothetical protein
MARKKVAPLLPLETQVHLLSKLCTQLMQEAVEQGDDPYEVQVYLAGKRDVYVQHVIDVLAHLGVAVEIPLDVGL